MPHIIEAASSGRSKCRGCGKKIEKDELRLGERQPNPFGEGDMTLWFHPLCAAFKRPEVFLEVIDETDNKPENTKALKAFAEHAQDHRRRARINGVQKAPTGRARCRNCKELIEKDMWRIPLAFFEDGRFQPAGFVHVTCSQEYFETTDIVDAAIHFGSDLSEEEIAEFKQVLAGV